MPLRIEIGPRDVASSTVVVCRRDVPGKSGKEFGVGMEEEALAQHVNTKLREIQDSMLETAIAFRDRHIVDVSSYEELKSAIGDNKWARGGWAGR